MKSHLALLPSATPQTEVMAAAPVTQALANHTIFCFQAGHVYRSRARLCCRQPLARSHCQGPLMQLPHAGEEVTRKAPGCLGFLTALRVARHLTFTDFQPLLGTKSTYDSFENCAIHTLAGLASQRSIKQNHGVSANRIQHRCCSSPTCRTPPLPDINGH